jgi:aspartate carbamoyltransferase regulatory subunit
MATDKLQREEKTIKVSALTNGTVIDHLAGGTGLRVLRVLGLDKGTVGPVAIGLALDSRKLGKKDLIKIEKREITQEEVNKIALISPEATLSIIRETHVVRKFRPEIPDLLESVVRCVNPSCVSNHERIRSRFRVLKRDPLRLRCEYCERAISGEDVELL